MQLLIINLKIFNSSTIVFNNATVIYFLVDIISVQESQILRVIEVIQVVIVIIYVVWEAWIVAWIVFWWFLFIQHLGLLSIGNLNLRHHLLLFDFSLFCQNLFQLESFKLLLFNNLVKYCLNIFISLRLFAHDRRKHCACSFACCHSSNATVINHWITTIAIIRNASFRF